MSSAVTQASPPSRNKEDADRVLANLARTTRTISPEPIIAPAPTAVTAAPIADTPAPELPLAPKAVETPRPVARRKVAGGPTIYDKSFEINLGKGFKMLTVRIPNEKHAQLFLIAAQNKLSGNGEPSTLNDLILRAVDHLLTDAA